MAEPAELLFFDTFSHDSSEELNLDLVQFPKPVYVSEVRIIPLGARVVGDFPGGVRLGATNPSQFHIDFFVNDLSKPGASTFETLGNFEYSQNGKIHMDCEPSSETSRKIPTDGLVLKGWYTTITLAVYGSISKTLIEPIPPAAVTRVVTPPPRVSTPPEQPVGQQAPWSDIPPAVDVYNSSTYPQDDYDHPPYQSEYYNRDGPKDPRAYHHGENDPHWDRRDDKDRREISRDRDARRSREKDRPRHSPLMRGRSRSIDRGRSRERYSRSHSRDKDYPPRSLREDGFRRDSRSPYRDRPVSRDKDWDRSFKRDRDEHRRHRGPSYERTRCDSYEKRTPTYDKRPPSFERRGPSFERHVPYENRAPSYEKRSPPYDKVSSFDKRDSSFERRHDKNIPGYDRVRDSNYDNRSRSPIRDDPRKRPRTPPVDLPRRPHTPEEMTVQPIESNLSPKSGHSILSDECVVGYDHNGQPIPSKEHFNRGFKQIKLPVKLEPEKTRSPVKHGNFPENLQNVKILDSQHSPVNKSGSPVNSPCVAPEDNTSLDVEQFEPILSDEDICDDADNNFVEMDYDVNDYCSNDEIIKTFNPFRCEWKKYNPSHKSAVYLTFDIENKKHVMNSSVEVLADLNPDFKKLLNLIKDHKNNKEKYLFESFTKLSQDEHEEWVHTCEQMRTLIQNISSDSDILLRIIKAKKMNTDEDNSEFQCVLQMILQFCKIGLDYDLALAQRQATYKIRHIKCGIKLVEVLASQKYSEDFILRLLDSDIDIFIKLLDLYFKEPMALSIKLMILKTLDSCLNSKAAIEYFLSSQICNHFKEKLSDVSDKPDGKAKNDSTKNGYQLLLMILKKNPLARIKFAIHSLINKLNLYELMKKLNETILTFNRSVESSGDHIPDISENEIEFIINSLEEILCAYRNECFQMSQPNRFLPVSGQFEIHKTSSNDILFNFFDIHKMAEICLFLLTCPMTYIYPVITNPIYELFCHLISCNEGMIYLYNNMKTSVLLLKLFLQAYAQQSEEEQMLVVQDISNCTSFQQLGLELSFKLQAHYYIDVISDMINSADLMQANLIDKLNSLFCLTFTGLGKLAVTNVLSMANNINCLLDVVEKDVLLKATDKEENVQDKQKIPAKNYAVDLIVLTVQFTTDITFLKRHGKRLLYIAKKHDLFESSIECHLQGLLPYLKPLDRPNFSSVDNIGETLEFIKISAEHVTSAPGELITSLRILKQLCIAEFEIKKLELGPNKSFEYSELKYKYAIIQLFSMDGVAHLVGILEKLCNYFEQPSLHSATFVSTHGFQIVNIVLPSLELLHQILSYVILCRNTQFKDLTAVPVILQTYNLMSAYPVTSLAHKIAQKACREAINTLLAYTQPIAEEASENESIHKSLWTLLCSEIFKYVMTAPYTFIPGLSIFTELLPLPLPIQTKFRLSDTELSNMINNRKLWSAHLHTLCSGITEMIQSICLSNCHSVISLLKRVSIQMSDLAPNISMCVTKAVLDLLVSNVCNAGTVLPQPLEPVNQTVVRLLNFLAYLTAHSSIKCTLSHIVKPSAATPKSEDKYSLIIPILTGILTTVSDSQIHIQAQECVLSIINSLCDTEITLLTNAETVPCENGDEAEKTKAAMTTDLYLANALPSKEVILAFVNATFDYINNESSSTNLFLPILRTYFLLTEHDYGFYHFKLCLDKNKQIFYQMLNKIVATLTKDGLDCVNEFLEIIKLLQTLPEDVEIGDGVQLNRTSSLSIQEISDILNWHKNKDDHPLLTLEKFLQENNIEELLVNLKTLLTALNDCKNQTSSTENTSSYSPPTLVAESLAVQFASRTFCTQGDVRDDHLVSSFWLGVPMNTEDEIDPSEMTSCDLAEVTRQFLPPDTDLIVEAERLLHLSPTQSRPPSETSMFRTKRLHVPRDNKRPYITPASGRGSLGNGVGSTGQSLSVSNRPPIDAFRSRPSNTSRPPSLHVDDFLALEGCGAQPVRPTGYNKLPVMTSRMRSRGGITITDRGRFASATPSISNSYRRGRGSWSGNSATGPNQNELSQPSMHYARSSQHFQSTMAQHATNQYSTSGSWSPISRGNRGSRGLRHSRSGFTR